MLYSRRFWNRRAPSGETNARARVPSHFNSNTWSSESNGSRWSTASIGRILRSNRSAMGDLLLRRRDARPEGRHQVLGLPGLRGGRYLDRLALDLRLDHLKERLAVPVLVPPRVEVRREGGDEVDRELHLVLRDRDRLRGGDLGRRLHLVRVVEYREDERAVHGPQGDEVLLPPQGRLRERDLPGPQEGLAEQLPGLHARLERSEVVARLVEQRANLVRLHKPDDVHVLARLHADALDFVVRQRDVLGLPDRVALHHLLRLDGHVVDGAHVRSLQRGPAGRVERGERDVLRLRRGVH